MELRRRTRPLFALRRRRDDSGAAAVEFALVLVPLLIIIFGLIQYGIFFFAMQAGNSAAREAARRVSVGDCPTSGELTTFVQNRVSGSASSNVTVTRVYKDASGTAITWPANPPVVGGTVTVTVSFQPQNFNFPFVPFIGNATVQAESVARVEDLTAGGTCA